MARRINGGLVTADNPALLVNLHYATGLKHAKVLAHASARLALSLPREQRLGIHFGSYGLIQKVDGSIGSRTLIWPLVPSVKPLRAKVRKAPAFARAATAVSCRSRRTWECQETRTRPWRARLGRYRCALGLLQGRESSAQACRSTE